MPKGSIEEQIPNLRRFRYMLSLAKIVESLCCGAELNAQSIEPVVKDIREKLEHSPMVREHALRLPKVSADSRFQIGWITGESARH